MHTKRYASIASLIVLLGFGLVPSWANIAPLVQIPMDRDSVTPFPYGGMWSYYIVPPGTTSSGVTYEGDTTSVQYLFSASSAFTYTSTSIARGNTLYSNLGNPLTQNVNNPLMNGMFEQVPRAVRMNQLSNPAIEKEQERPLSVLFDVAFTILIQSGQSLPFLINTTEMFFLQIEVAESGSSNYYDEDYDSGSIISFHSPTLIAPNPECCLNTFPVYPINSSIVEHIFWLYSTSTTVITVSAYRNNLDIEPVFLPMNSTYSSKISQGVNILEEANSNDDIANQSLIFDFFEFMLSVREGEYYDIGVDFYPRFPYDHLFTICNDAVYFLVNMDGILESTPYGYYATQDANITLVVYAMGPQDMSYTVYFQRAQTPDVSPTFMVPFNEPFSPLGTTYEFSLTSPAVIAVNATSSSSFRFDLYRYDSFKKTTTKLLTSSSTSSHLQIEQGNLYGDFLMDIGTNWLYFPAGMYQVKFVQSSANHKIQFHMLKVNQLQSSTDIVVNRQTIRAFELNYPKFNGNSFNITTLDANSSLGIQFEYGAIYKAFSSDFMGSYSTPFLGVNADANSTEQLPWMPMSDFNNPIIILRPYMAKNVTDGTEFSTFNSSVRISVINKPNNFMSNLNNPLDEDFFVNKFEKQSSANQTYQISDASVGQNDTLLFVIPFNVIRNSIYNVSIIIVGNYSTNSMNASITDFSISSGHQYDADIFGESIVGDIQSNNQSTRMYSALVLTTRAEVFLWFRLLRAFLSQYLNFTAIVSFQRLNVPHLVFDIPDYGEYQFNAIPLPGYRNFTGRYLSYVGSYQIIVLQTGGGFLPMATFAPAMAIFTTAVVLYYRRKRSHRM